MFCTLNWTIVSNSLLSYLLSDLLFTNSESQWNENLVRMCYTFLYLFKEKGPTTDTSRFNKVAQVLGQDVNGNPIEKKSSCSCYQIWRIWNQDESKIQQKQITISIILRIQKHHQLWHSTQTTKMKITQFHI